jgi:hypothetical protein
MGHGRQGSSGCGVQAEAPGITIDGLFDRAQQLGCALHLVDNGSIHASQEGDGIGASPCKNRVVVERYIGSLVVDELPDQGGLPGLPRSRDHDDRRVLESGGDALGGKARDELRL